jgi:hypothetical protein
MAEVRAATNLYFIGQAGTDAGGWYIGADGKIHRIPGWEAQATLELSRAVNVLGIAAQLKTPGLAETTIRGLMDFTQKEIAQHLPQGGVLVVR